MKAIAVFFAAAILAGIKLQAGDPLDGSSPSSPSSFRPTLKNESDEHDQPVFTSPKNTSPVLKRGAETNALTEVPNWPATNLPPMPKTNLPVMTNPPAAQVPGGG